jgi:predicted XRE-type DNA-binding protein
VFADIGFTRAEAAELSAKSSLIIAIKDTIEERKLTQQEAARLCGTDRPTLSKVFRGRMENVAIDRLSNWLNALGRDVETVVESSPRTRRRGRLLVIEAAPWRRREVQRNAKSTKSLPRRMSKMA